MGDADRGLSAVRRAVVIDPLNTTTFATLALTAYYGRSYTEALQAFTDLARLTPDYYQTSWLGRTYYQLGELEKARSACERVTVPDAGQDICLVIVYDKLGRHADAERKFAETKAARGEAYSVGYGDIYAQRGDTAKALECLETAVRVGDNDLKYVRASPMFDPIRQEPRFQAILKALKFPN
jgi:tetratricopeptide (TPR) repeat protein